MIADGGVYYSRNSASFRPASNLVARRSLPAPATGKPATSPPPLPAARLSFLNIVTRFYLALVLTLFAWLCWVLLADFLI